MEVEAWGTININVSTPISKVITPFPDVDYVLNFSISLISLDRALNRRFNWDIKTMCVTNSNGKALFKVKRIFG